MEDSRQPWRSPLLWPPKTWRLNRTQQFLTDTALTLLGIGLLVTAFAALAALFMIPYQAITALKDGKDEVARNYLLALGALLGVPFLVWRTMIASHQAAISRESLYTQLFTSGVERLGAEKVSKIIESKPIFKKKDENWERGSDGLPIPEVDHKGTPLTENKTIERTDINIEVRLGAVYAQSVSH